MNIHKFTAGQSVTFTATALRKQPAGRFQILRTLPAEHGVNQYRLKSNVDGHERVAQEFDLE